MRRFIILMVVILLVLGAAGVSGGTALAKSSPFLPGDPLFTVQYYAEQTQVRLGGSPEQQAGEYFALAERRLEDLVKRFGTTHELEAMQYLEDAINRVVYSLANLPEGKDGAYKERLHSLLGLSEAAVNLLGVAPGQNPDQVASFSAKLSTLRLLGTDVEENPDKRSSVFDVNSVDADQDASLDTLTTGNTWIAGDPLNVPFPPGSYASQHKFFPLVGEHANLECVNCHTDGVYKGIPSDCGTCHITDRPADHYAGDCATCHSPSAWEDAIFDHTLTGTSDCLSCHADNKPINHYGNQCGACHNTIDWSQTRFNHKVIGANDCKACHTSDSPANHYGGQCSQCHNTGNWQDADFNHSGQADCKSCHNGNKPANHFGGQCSSCHSTQTWRGASFNHNGRSDCKSCHSQDKPSNHFGGQCSQCHSTNRWDGAEFTHNGQADCKACHAGDRPREHSGGQCSQCHNTRDWDDADDDHDDDGDDEKGDEDDEDDDD